MLHSLNMEGYTRSVPWCAPSAIACLTGRPLTDTTSKIARMTGVPYGEVEGVWIEESILALLDYGFISTPVDVIGRYPRLTHGPRLGTFLADRTPYERGMPMLIQVAGHVLTAHYGFACDNWTKRPVPIARFPKLGRLVKSAYTITPRKE